MTDHLDVDRIDALAAIIREVDGNHSLGASKLAEAIMSHHLVIDVQIAEAMRPQQHPLTDEIIRENFIPDHEYMDWDNNWICKGFNNDSLRTAADWQLEQVIEWLKSNLASSIYLSPRDYYGDEINVDDLLDDLKTEMRPKEDN